MTTSALISTELQEADEAGKKQVFSDEEDAVQSARHTAHVPVAAGSGHRQRVENDTDDGQRSHQIVLRDVLEFVVEFADQSRVVRMIHLYRQRRLARLCGRVLQPDPPLPAVI